MLFDVSSLTSFKNLKTLNLNYTSVENVDLSGLVKLKSVSFQSCERLSTMHGLKTLSSSVYFNLYDVSNLDHLIGLRRSFIFDSDVTFQTTAIFHGRKEIESVCISVSCFVLYLK